LAPDPHDKGRVRTRSPRALLIGDGVRTDTDGDDAAVGPPEPGLEAGDRPLPDKLDEVGPHRGVLVHVCQAHVVHLRDRLEPQGVQDRGVGLEDLPLGSGLEDADERPADDLAVLGL